MNVLHYAFPRVLQRVLTCVKKQTNKQVANFKSIVPSMTQIHDEAIFDSVCLPSTITFGSTMIISNVDMVAQQLNAFGLYQKNG